MPWKLNALNYKKLYYLCMYMWLYLTKAGFHVKTARYTRTYSIVIGTRKSFQVTNLYKLLLSMEMYWSMCPQPASTYVLQRSCTHELTIQPGIGAESCLGWFCCGLFLRLIRYPQVFGWSPDGSFPEAPFHSPWQVDSRL